jgi:outer membrane lipase/esterase
VTQQVGLFLSAVGSVAPSSALYAVWIGSNDLFNTIGAGVVGPTAVAQAIGAAQTEAAAINALAAAGARNILVPLVSDLGTTPVLTALGGGASAAGTALALAYNAELEADLAGLSAIPGIHLSILDTFTLQDNAVADPAAFGFSNVTDPCYIGALTGGGTVCATPGQFLFWDHEHPTATSHAIIAEAALNEVAEPATFAVLGTGLAGIASLRRRRQQAAA